MSSPDPTYDPSEELRTEEEKESAYIPEICPECEEKDGEHSCGECGHLFKTSNPDQISSHLCGIHFEAETWALSN
jgi:hypothetical protein